MDITTLASTDAANTFEDARTSNTGLTSCVLREVQTPLGDENSHTGVSTRNAPSTTKHKKVGFTIIAISTTIAALTLLTRMGSVPVGLIGIVVLWFVLKIKKHGVSYWDAMKD